MHTTFPAFCSGKKDLIVFWIQIDLVAQMTTKDPNVVSQKLTPIKKCKLFDCSYMNSPVWPGMQWGVEAAVHLHSFLPGSSYWILLCRTALRQVLKTPSPNVVYIQWLEKSLLLMFFVLVTLVNLLVYNHSSLSKKNNILKKI